MRGLDAASSSEGELGCWSSACAGIAATKNAQKATMMGANFNMLLSGFVCLD